MTTRSMPVSIKPTERLHTNRQIVFAAPSRDMDRPKPWEEDADYERNSFYRNSQITHSQPYINYNSSYYRCPPIYGCLNQYCFAVVSSLRHIPKPGYGTGTKANTLGARVNVRVMPCDF